MVSGTFEASTCHQFHDKALQIIVREREKKKGERWPPFIHLNTLFGLLLHDFFLMDQLALAVYPDHIDSDRYGAEIQLLGPLCADLACIRF